MTMVVCFTLSSAKDLPSSMAEINLHVTCSPSRSFLVAASSRFIANFNVLAHARRAPSVGNRIDDLLANPFLQRERNVEVPLEVLRPFACRDQDDELRQLLLTDALKRS